MCLSRYAVRWFVMREMNRAKEINVKEWLDVLKRRMWIIAACCLICTALGWYMSSRPVVPLYESETRLLIKGDPKSMQTVQNMIREPIVMERVVKQFNLQKSAARLRNQISLGNIDNSQIFTLKVIDTDPAFAATLANAVVEVYKSTLSELLGWSDITVLTAATLNEQPINPTSNRMMMIGLIGGFALGIGAAFLRESLDDTLRSKEEVEHILGVPVLGTLSNIGRKDIRAKERQKDVNLSLRGESVGS